MKWFSLGMNVLAIVATASVVQADITIGVSLSETGPASSLGIAEKNAVTLGPKVIAGQKVRYVFYNDATDASTAVQNVKRLISEDKIDILIGGTTVSNTMAVVDTVAGAKTPMISCSPGPAVISSTDEKRKWVFNSPANEGIYMARLTNHMASKGVKSVSVIAVDDAYGENYTAALKKLVDSKGIKILAIEKYKRTDASATAQVLHAMQANPDAVLIISTGTPAALPHVALIERGYKGKIYQSGGGANADFLRIGGKALEGSYMPAPPVLVAEQLPKDYPTKKEAMEFVKAYEPKFGPRSMFASHSWDALKIIQAAVPKAMKGGKPGTEQFRSALRDAIENSKGVKGAGILFTLSPTDHSGVNMGGILLMKIENGKWKLEDHAAL
ncbi:ABC transporter substrate-binding protein [Geobacter sp. AOG1]|uniref:ABC transporter substrate-binding protein n=1 Tax=Geobacter sp. AOG1 TaxID=1566346 RepID=UPI001CC47490|nr:ABC transporter substrate-binding protein [Geobacter sp. AOG1]GFE56307.1 branched-chain amino acid ABC transporter substrate-binding protein [Geobacter sp. AOG1]